MQTCLTEFPYGTDSSVYGTFDSPQFPSFAKRWQSLVWQQLKSWVMCILDMGIALSRSQCLRPMGMARQSLVPADGLCANHSFLLLVGCSLRHIPIKNPYGDELTHSWVEFLGCWCISIRTPGSLNPCCSASASFIVSFFVALVRSLPKSWRSWSFTLLIRWIKEDSICQIQLQYLE